MHGLRDRVTGSAGIVVVVVHTRIAISEDLGVEAISSCYQNIENENRSSINLLVLTKTPEARKSKFYT